MEFVSDKEIRIGRELSDLDKFALDFVKILGKRYCSAGPGQARTLT